MEIFKLGKKAVLFLFTAVLLAVLFFAEPTEKKAKKVYLLSETELIGTGLEWEIVQNNFPVFRCLFFYKEQDYGYEVMVSNLSPLYRYLRHQELVSKMTENKTNLSLSSEMKQQLFWENAKPRTQEEAVGAAEEQTASEGSEKDSAAEEIATQESGSTQNTEEIQQTAETLENTGERKEAEAVFLGESDFVLNTQKQMEYDWNLFEDPEKIRETFFAVDATTQISDDRIRPQTLLEKEIHLDKGNGEPQILIYHTHSQESFADSIPGDPNTSIVGAGEYLARLLQEDYGYAVLHHTGEYDVETRDYAYSYALPNIEALLAEYPSIEVVIDLHRDAVAEDRKLVSNQNGKQAAQLMFFNGLSYTKKQGSIGYLKNPYIDDNLAFSFQMQVLCNEYYPGLTRRIYLKGYRYSMHLCEKSLLIELGAQTNTCEEVRNTLDILAQMLHLCLSGE